MTSSNYHQTPVMYPAPNEHARPVPPVREEYAGHPQQEELLPRVPPRADKHEEDDSTKARQTDCSCNYNRYATKKTISNGFLEFALLTSNVMQLRTLITQKHHDGIWIASLVLVCISILAQIGLAYILIVVGKGNIQNPQKQPRLEKFNNIALFITLLISVMNVIINTFMSTTNPSSYVDLPALEASKNQT